MERLRERYGERPNLQVFVCEPDGAAICGTGAVAAGFLRLPERAGTYRARWRER